MLFRSVKLLRSIITWRLQADVHGGMDADTRRLLRVTSNGSETMLSSGTVLTRDWQGVEHRVEVADDHYIYDGKPWKSLSGIARAITGTRWNGPRFFGLRQEA